MNRFLPLLLTLFLALRLTAQEVPLIDRELFYDNPEIAGAQLSPDAKWMTFIKPHKGTMNVYLKKAAEPFEKARPITADTLRPIRNYFWSDDSRYVLFVQDKGGNENFHVYAVDPFAKAEAASGVPPARNLTPVENARATIYQVSKKNPQIMWVGLNDRDPAWHDLYELNIATGERKLLRENKDRIGGWSFDWDEQPRLALRSSEDGSTEILRVDPDGMTKLYSGTALEEVYPIGWSKDNKQFYLVTNKDRNFTELTLFDPVTMKETPVEKDPLGKVDFGGARINEVTRELENTRYVDAKPRLYFRNKKLEKEYDFLKSKFPGKEIDYSSMDKAQKLALISVYSDTDPGEVYLFDRATSKLTFQYRPRPKLKPEYMAPMEPITYKSSDGLEIPAYLTLPKGKEAKNLPLLVVPHGGPWGRDEWGYNRQAQFWANRGYAVLQMNFRGSTGYGKKFLDAGNGEWGQKMQDDITWGVKHLVAQGIADPKRVGITGGSYGGYATLAGVTFTPDLYRAAVAVVAPSNLNTLLGSIPAYWEGFRQVLYRRMADPATPEGREMLEKQSPLNHIEKIKTPLMIVQGANDPRVKKAEADQIVVAMRDKGIPVEYILAPDEGHGFARPVNNMAYLAASEKFLAKQLGGRYQESMTPEVAKRLGEITVDVKTVEKPRRADEIAALKSSLQPVRDLKANIYKYKVDLAMAGQSLRMDVTRTVRADGGNWLIRDESKSVMGNMVDENRIRQKTLLPVSRHIEQGPMLIDYDYADGAVRGRQKMGGQETPVDVRHSESLLPEGAGLDLVLGALELKEGGTFFYKTFDPQSQQIKTYEVKVGAREKVSVDAGNFDAWVVEATEVGGAAKTTYWIADGVPVKYRAVLPEMGGAVVTGELMGVRP